MPDNDPNLMTIFAEALERTDPPARAAYLDDACAGNAALRRRVEALLAAHDGAGRFLEPEFSETSDTAGPRSPEVSRTSVPETDASSRPTTVEHGPVGLPTTIAGPASAGRPGGSVAGQVIAGRYTLAGVLGEGGMGTVYRADQTEPVKRQVALKLIRIGMDSRTVLARFDAERQALALMDHPNIARVYDGGTTEAGQPFFVMELVSGVPITEYCDNRRLSVQARLELFVSVCQAVQHAHQKGIIHRDLKPGNVLVTEVDGRPTPKVIDFGVARATEQKLTDLSLVETGAIVGTPAYMSPEQADPSSMDIDTRTDVYALGVILYELLAGSPPIDARQFRRGAFLEMLRMVREIDPPRPSTRVSTAEALPDIAANRNIEPAQLKRALRGDLDWIVMKALEKDRTRRYDTANGFAADVLRHLAHEPVQAAPPSRVYRVRKFVWKHRGAVVAASLVVLALLAGIAGTTWGLIRAMRARAAEAERVEERDAAIEVANDRAQNLKYQLGVSDFLLASAAYDDGNGNVEMTAERLGNVPENQRRWEWRYLKRLTRGGLFTLYGHRGPVSSASFSRDGMRILTASRDKTTNVWDARTGASLLELKGHREQVNSASFSPDGTRIVTASWDTTRVWDAQTGTPLLELKGRTGFWYSASFSPDGTRIVTANGDETVTVWDARTGITLLELRGHADIVSSASFSPDGTRIVTAGDDRTVKVWDARRGTPLLDLKGHIIGVNSASFSPDGTRIVTAGIGDTVKVWDARSGTPVLELKGSWGYADSASFSPDGTRIVTANGGKTASVWDARTGMPLLELRGHTGAVMCASFSPDGMRIVTSSEDETAKVWDARTREPVLDLNGHTGAVSSASFSPDGAWIVTGGRDKAVVWDARTGTPVLDLNGHTGGARSVSFSPDGARIVTGSGYMAMAWDARTGTPLLELKGHVNAVTCASISPDGTRIVTGSADRTAELWDARTGTPLLELRGHATAVTCASFSPDGARIVTAGSDNTAKVWDARTGTLALDLKGHTGAVMCASFSPDGTRIATGSADKMAKLWDARTGTPLLHLTGHADVVRCASFSPDGTRIVTASWDNTAKVWDARTGMPLLDLKGHTMGVNSASFSPDGTRIVTGGRDNTAKVWDAGPATPLLELKGHTADVRSVSFSRDGTRIVTSSEDETARVWDARTGALLLDLRGHTGAVSSASFSPDGTRIVTVSSDQTGKVWDAESGTALLDLKGQTDWATIVSFSPDGNRIVTSSVQLPTKVWNARTGQELKGEPIPPTLQPSHVSPDRRWVALAIGNHVELIPVQPNEVELSHRRVLMQPKFGLYREAYDAATKANDGFAARFYLNLLPPLERTRIKAETIVADLFGRLLLRDDVLAALQAQPAADPEIQAACLKLAGTWPESAPACNEAGWPLVRDPGRPEADYQRGLRLAKAACRLEPENAAFLNTLGVAQYRCGLMAEALATLTRTNALNQEKEPSDLAFLALAQHRLGLSDQASATLSRLREVMKDPQQARNPESRAFLREAETIELDRVFPADPFAPSVR